MSSTVSDTQFMDVQKIVVTLDQPDLTIEPGNATRLVVTMTNQQPTPDRLLLEVEGIDIEWYNIPVSAVNVAPGATVSERINFKVAKRSENRAGSYPFLVRVVAMETGEVGIAQAMLIVKSFDRLEVEMEPRRATAKFMHPLNDFAISVVNEGNVDRTLELFANDPDDDCVYEFDADHIVLKPGQAQTILMAARPKSVAWIGSPRVYSFAVSARASEDRYVTAKTNGQIERHALISPIVGLVLLLLAFAGGFYVAFRPTPPTPVKLNNFAASPDTVKEGDPVTLTWDVSGDKPTIKLSHHTGKNGTDISDGELEKRSGNQPFVPAGPQTTYTITVTGPGNTVSGARSEQRTVTINVTPRPAPPKPVLTDLTADSTMEHQGEPVVLAWKARNADSFIIDPGGIKLSGLMQTYSLMTDRPGDFEYTVRAVSVDQKMTSEKKIKISVVSRDKTVAEIVSFGPPKGTIYFGDSVPLRWVTHRAASIRVENEKGDLVVSSQAAAGSQSITVNDTLYLTLIATDSLGNKTEPKKITIKPEVKPLPPPVVPTTIPTGKPDAGTTPQPMPTPPNDGANPGGKTN